MQLTVAMAAIAVMLGNGTVAHESATVPAEPCARLFGYSQDPEQVVLRLTRRGGFSEKSIEFELFGDGRLEKIERHVSGAVMGRYRRVISQSELRDLVGVAVDHGLMDLDAASRDPGRTGIGADGRAVPSNAQDASIDVVEVFLVDYVGPGHAGGPAESRFSAQGTWFLARQFPESEQLAGVLEIFRRIRQFGAEMTAVGAKPGK